MCEYKKHKTDNINHCDKLRIDVPDNVCEGKCKNGTWADKQKDYWDWRRTLNPEETFKVTHNQKLTIICKKMKCSVHRHSCQENKQYCLYLTRQTDLTDWINQGNHCPLNKF